MGFLIRSSNVAIAVFARRSIGWWIVGNLRFPCMVSPSNPATLTDRGIIIAVASLWQTIASGACFSRIMLQSLGWNSFALLNAIGYRRTQADRKRLAFHPLPDSATLPNKKRGAPMISLDESRFCVFLRIGVPSVAFRRRMVEKKRFELSTPTLRTWGENSKNPFN